MTQRFDDRVTVYLALESREFASSQLTLQLSLQPDRQWAIGDARGATGKKWECHGWVIEVIVDAKENGVQSASELIPIALERFESRTRPLIHIISSLSISIQKYIVLAILAEQVPAIELSHSSLQFLSELGATFQIDISGP